MHADRMYGGVATVPGNGHPYPISSGLRIAIIQVGH